MPQPTIGRKNRVDGSDFRRHDEGLPQNFENYPTDVPMKSPHPEMEMSNLQLKALADEGIKPSPDYYHVNQPKGIAEQPRPIPREIVKLTKEIPATQILA